MNTDGAATASFTINAKLRRKRIIPRKESKMNETIITIGEGSKAKTDKFTKKELNEFIDNEAIRLNSQLR